MKRLLILFATAALLFVGGCSKYDDSTLTGRVDNLENRVAKLEELCKQMNTNISSLQALVNALQQNDCITAVTPITKEGKDIGYTITFAKGSPITIYHGKDGQDGEDGKDGVDGQDGHTPLIGVRQDSDGVYYWTIDDEWLTDDAGNRIKAEGRDGEDGTPGQDGITPQLKVENGYWYLSSDGGESWTRLDKANTNDSFFVDVDIVDSDHVMFVLSNGTTLYLPTVSSAEKLDIVFDSADLILMRTNTERDIAYTIVGSGKDITIDVVSSADIKAKVVPSEQPLSGTVHIVTGPTIDEYSHVLVLVSNGIRTIVKRLSFEEAGIVVDDTATIIAPPEGGIVELGYLSNISTRTVISKADAEWIAMADTRAMVHQSVSLNIAPNNTGVQRRATVSVRSDEIDMAIDYTIIQDAQTDAPYIAYTANRMLFDLADDAFDAHIVSHTYRDGQGIIVFDKAPSTIEAHAFQDLWYRLTSISFPEGVVSIGDSAFESFQSLESVSLPESLVSIGAKAFNGCTAMKTIRLPENLVSIGDRAFISGANLESITIPGNVKTIGFEAFRNCYRMKSVVIEGQPAVGTAAFVDCRALESFAGPLASPDGRCLLTNGCVVSAFAPSGLTEYVIPDGVVSIGESAFENCSDMTSITISDGVISIQKKAFYSNVGSKYKTFKLPDTIETIGSDAFHNCIALRTIHIPKNVYYIGSGAFGDCGNLAIYCHPKTPPELDMGFESVFPISEDISIYVPIIVTTTYKQHWYWYENNIRGLSGL